jgi:hypothetical protein
MSKAELNDITFKKTNGGLGRSAGSDDVISGLIFAGMTGLSFGDAATDLKGFDEVYMNQGAAAAYARRFTYPEELEGAGIVFTKPVYDSNGQSTLTSGQNAKNTLYYHITEFFRMSPSGVLYVMIKANTSPVGEAAFDNSNNITDDGDITKLQIYAGGNIRQIGVFNPTQLNVGNVQKECANLEAKHIPLSVVLTYYGKTGVTPAAIPLQDLTAEPQEGQELVKDGRCNVSLLIGCDRDTDLAAALGEFSFYGCIGLCIGAISKAKVHESIAWVGNFPLGLKVPALFNGSHIRNISTSDLEALNGNHYLFVITHAGDADNYFNDSHTLDVDSSDYAYIENVRTIDKACRGIRGKLLPWLSSPLEVDPGTGKLDTPTVEFLETTAGEALEEMEKAGEISGYKAEIDPDQNVISTGNVEIIIKKVPVGVMRKVRVKIGFASSLS